MKLLIPLRSTSCYYVLFVSCVYLWTVLFVTACAPRQNGVLSPVLYTNKYTFSATTEAPTSSSISTTSSSDSTTTSAANASNLEAKSSASWSLQNSSHFVFSVFFSICFTFVLNDQVFSRFL